MPKYYFEYARIDDLKGDDTVYGPMDTGYNRRYLKSCDIVADSVEGAEEIFMKERPECEILRQETYDEPNSDDSVEQEEIELTTCPVCGEERFNDITGLCVDCGYDENAWGSFDESIEKSDKRLSPTSYKYKGYRISLDHRIGAYSIFDKHGEMEDHGYLSKEAAEKFIDSLIDARQLKNKEESINEEIKVLRIRGKEYPIRDKSFLTDDKVASINNEYGLKHIFNVKTPDGKRYKIYDSGFGNLGHSDACAILAEDYTVGGYVHTSIEYKGEHIIPSKYKPGKYFVSINNVGEAPQKKFFDSADEAKTWIDSLNEALPALAVGAITAAATGFGQGLGDKLGSKIFGEEVEETEWSEKEINDFLVSRSNNFTLSDDVIKTYYKGEKDKAVQILKKYYKVVDVSDGRHSEDDEMVYVIAYAEPIKKINEEFDLETIAAKHPEEEDFFDTLRELSDDGFDITDKEDFLTGLGADLGFDKEEQKYFLRKWKKYINK